MIEAPSGYLDYTWSMFRVILVALRPNNERTAMISVYMFTFHSCLGTSSYTIRQIA